jgi:plastocyanin
MMTSRWLHRVVYAAVAVGAVLVSAGCFAKPPSTATESSGGDIRLTSMEWKFVPDTMRVTAGRPVTLVFENHGLIEHDVSVSTLGVHLHAQPREAAQQTLTFDTPGSYEYECSIYGHKAAGMKGRIVVTN